MTQHEDPHGREDDQVPQSGHELAKSDADHRDHQSNAKDHRAEERPIPTKNEILLRLNSLAEITALGVFAPPKANSVRATLQAMLPHLDTAQSSGAIQFGDAELKKLRDHPDLLRLVARLLSDQTLATIMEGFKDE